MKTLFVSDETEKVDLGDGFWVEIPIQISYGKSQELFTNIDAKNIDEKAIGEKMLLSLIIKWNLTEEDGTVAGINEANFKRLPIWVIKKISDILAPKLILSKKK